MTARALPSQENEIMSADKIKRTFGLLRDYISAAGGDADDSADLAEARVELEWLLADRQRWINVAAKMGNHDARPLATEGWTKA